MLQGHTFPQYTTEKGNTLIAFDQVQEFNDTFGVETRTTANVRVAAASLRFELIREEFEELIEAYTKCDIVEIADALGDIVYVVIGAAQVFGIAKEVENVYAVDTNDYGREILVTVWQEQTLSFLRTAILHRDVKSVVDILAFILKAADSAAEFYGIPLYPVVDAIHKSNMSKLAADGSVIRRPEDNKVLKGENYVTPTADIIALVCGAEDADAS